MTASRLWTVFCDGCGQWEDAGIGHTAKEARAGLRSKGWLLDRRGALDFCPQCIESGVEW